MERKSSSSQSPTTMPASSARAPRLLTWGSESSHRARHTQTPTHTLKPSVRLQGNANDNKINKNKKGNRPAFTHTHVGPSSWAASSFSFHLFPFYGAVLLLLCPANCLSVSVLPLRFLCMFKRRIVTCKSVVMAGWLAAKKRALSNPFQDMYTNDLLLPRGQSSQKP
jgi:hypothetical protein